MTAARVRFEFDERRAAQAAARLLRASGGELPHLKLISLMYLAERRSLSDDGYSITGDRFVSMPMGPVLKGTMHLMRHGSSDSEWAKYVTPSADSSVRSTGEECRDGLSDYDCGLLDEVAAEFGRMDERELAEYTRALPEWERCGPAESPAEIDPAAIMKIAGHSDDAIAAVAEQLSAELAFRRKLREQAAKYGE